MEEAFYRKGSGRVVDLAAVGGEAGVGYEDLDVRGQVMLSASLDRECPRGVPAVKEAIYQVLEGLDQSRSVAFYPRWVAVAGGFDFKDEFFEIASEDGRRDDGAVPGVCDVGDVPAIAGFDEGGYGDSEASSSGETDTTVEDKESEPDPFSPS